MTMCSKNLKILKKPREDSFLIDFSVEDKDFQVVGKQVETEMFKLEGILTEKMLKQEKGLESVISSFYNLVYAFFPRYNEIEG